MFSCVQLLFACIGCYVFDGISWFWCGGVIKLITLCESLTRGIQNTVAVVERRLRLCQNV